MAPSDIYVGSSMDDLIVLYRKKNTVDASFKDPNAIEGELKAIAESDKESAEDEETYKHLQEFATRTPMMMYRHRVGGTTTKSTQRNTKRCFMSWIICCVLKAIRAEDVMHGRQDRRADKVIHFIGIRRNSDDN